MADLYVMAGALCRVQILLNNPRSIDPPRLELPEWFSNEVSSTTNVV
jgi:hypothetical protein